MVSGTNLERRERLAYLALYYAIQGNTERSEQVRRLAGPLKKNHYGQYLINLIENG